MGSPRHNGVQFNRSRMLFLYPDPKKSGIYDDDDMSRNNQSNMMGGRKMLEMNHSCCTENLRHKVSLVPPALTGSINTHMVVSAKVDFVGYGYVMVKGIVQKSHYYRTANDEEGFSMDEVPFYYRIDWEGAVPGDRFEVISAAVILAHDTVDDLEKRYLHDFYEEETVVKICIGRKVD